MDDFAIETGSVQDVVDGLGNVERSRADFGRGGLDETIHFFERDAVGGEDEGGSDGVDADVGSPVEGGGEGGVTQGLLREGIGA